ncbi:bis(5'-nucleosyl)-tetraphosphatase (symmetrical) [Candidatus Kinetoplastibacterium blastocrithidii TCC012E]|uniref:bis(5'-nucleosyl)-tetraphosphatase (symmetrical) n=1 Tax=Candidatus Kinetoplastidibacterium blastocrithidiae TCC012E TaxID=1208922 RepID=M1LC69_9PROT|nr:symmetrical bis(5'-nucleosyl)-tetraphosphatase [Candidatus Kinetoplastibacterium blastocrithidii]AFZ83229.1 diadenosine tetraphosphatase [Candidatus Kinetoplastibacterium blastocrithidii (ex Strigomonas culicis)]AGF50043.1 bis(5'-nucleosyl)-tetraphosphatase (symmetrical) [Candidatus Kinetoplastibacterium blastocrithidii TCC012E]
MIEYDETIKKEIWAIGDVQGCCDQLQELLSHNIFSDNKNIELWFAGDMINRGPKSLKTIEYIMSSNKRNICVLGNHDLHLLATFAGLRKTSRSDTLEEILNSPNILDIINWLRFRPLAHFDNGNLMVHAGVMAQWDIKKTLSLASEIQDLLRDKNWQNNIKKIFGNTSLVWHDELKNNKRLRTITNALTRIRLCTIKGKMIFSIKDPKLIESDNNIVPWFRLPDRKTKDITIIFGHWSSLGLFIEENLMCLDTGCVWGKSLTAVRLNDRKIISVNCSNKI